MENSELFGVFGQEVDERMQIVVTDMLTMEELGKNDEKIDEILRELHGLKGAAKMIGLSEIVEIIHLLEEMFRNVKMEKQEFDKSTIDHIFSEIDKVIDLTEGIKSKKEEKEGGNVKEGKKEVKGRMFLNIDFEKVDKLINEINDFSIFFNNLYFTKKEMKKLFDNKQDEIIKKELRKLYRSLDTMVTRGTIKIKSIHNSVFTLRMVPVGKIFERFKKDVRNVASKEGKKVDFIIRSGDIEADIHILRRLNDPILHILRNAIIHGIEPPGERIRIGKKEKGKVKISASYEGNNLVVKISNDGKPIDYNKIKKLAIEKGLVDERVANNYTNEQLLQFIFYMGFTTKKNANYTSGRGIGLDAVKKIVEDELKGSISISSNKDETTFILTIPLTLSSTDAVIINDAENTFAIPISSELTFVKYDESELRQIKNKIYLLKNNTIYPVLFLNDILQYEKSFLQYGNALIVNTRVNPFSIVFDKVDDIKNIVINKLPYPAEKIPFISGVTISEEGNPILIIDINDIKRFAGSNEIVSKGKIDKKKKEKKINVLLAEDSPTNVNRRGIKKSKYWCGINE